MFHIKKYAMYMGKIIEILSFMIIVSSLNKIESFPLQDKEFNVWYT